MRDRDNHNDHGSSDEEYLAYLRGTQPTTRPQPARPQPPRQDPSRPGSPTRVTRAPGAAAEPGRRGRHRLTGRLSRPLLLGTVAAATLTVLVGAGVALAPRTPGPGDGDAATVGLLDTAVVAPDASPDAPASPAPASGSASASPDKSPRATASPAPRKTRTTAPAPTSSAPAPRATGSGNSTGAGSQAAATTDEYADERRQILTLVNTERAKVGCGALSEHARLTTAAQLHSKDQAAHRNMSHTGSDGSDVGTRVTRAGYTWRAVGENVAMGYPTPAAVMQGWMNSPGHRDNILNCTYKHLGVGVAKGGSSLYWTQVFAASR